MSVRSGGTIAPPTEVVYDANTRFDLIASLPCYSLENVEAQRGRGVFDGSVRALQALNALGYGKGELRLDLVYNPVGPSLPPPQDTLEADYREALEREFGIVFDNLLTITTSFENRKTGNGDLSDIRSDSG